MARQGLALGRRSGGLTVTCHPFKSEDGKVTGFVCTRGRGPSRKKCATCGAFCGLLCDGCDRPICAECAVGPVSSQDFCPACFAPAWKVWLRLPDLEVPRERRHRRIAFRAWVRAHPNIFAELVPMTRAGRAAAGGDQ